MKIIKKFFKKIYKKYFKFKIWFYREVLSEIIPEGKPILMYPTLFVGKGSVKIGKDVLLGYFPSPQYHSGYSHIEARNPSANIEIGDGTMINNHTTIIANMASIKIGRNCRIGVNFQCFDSDFHGIKIKDRDNSSAIKNKDVFIEDNVFIGNNVIVLKGVKIGAGAIIAAGGIVVSDIPPNSIVAGSPAKVVKMIEECDE